MLHIGIDVHQNSSVFNVFDPAEGDGGTHRSQKVETTAEGLQSVEKRDWLRAKRRWRYRKRRTTRCLSLFSTDCLLRALEPLAGRCEVVFQVGPMAQWVAALLRPYAVKITVANPSRIPWLFRDGRKDRRKKAVVATAHKLVSIAFGMLRTGEVFDIARLTPSKTKPETKQETKPKPKPAA